MSDKNTSTLQSAIDNVTGTAQSLAGAFTGNQERQTAGADKRDEAQLKDDASHATAKVGPFSTSGSGAVAQDDPRRSEGSWNQTMGSAEESLGGLVGNESLKQTGIDQNREGKGQEAEGQLSDLGGGVSDRLKGEQKLPFNIVYLPSANRMPQGLLVALCTVLLEIAKNSSTTRTCMTVARLSSVALSSTSKNRIPESSYRWCPANSSVTTTTWSHERTLVGKEQWRLRRNWFS